PRRQADRWFQAQGGRVQEVRTPAGPFRTLSHGFVRRGGPAPGPPLRRAPPAAIGPAPGAARIMGPRMTGPKGPRRDGRCGVGPRARRLVRGWSAAAVATSAAVLSHAAADGQAPPAVLVLLSLALSGPLCMA